jgi:hypothetical protein
VQDNEQNMLLVRSTGICNRRSACNVDEACWHRIVSHQLTIAPRGAEAMAARFRADLKTALTAITLNSFCSAHRLTIIKADFKYTDMWFEDKGLEHAIRASCRSASCLEKRDHLALPLARAFLSWCAFTAKIRASMNAHQSSAAAEIWRIHWQSWRMTSSLVRPFLLLRTCCHITSMKWLRADSTCEYCFVHEISSFLSGNVDATRKTDFRGLINRNYSMFAMQAYDSAPLI